MCRTTARSAFGCTPRRETDYSERMATIGSMRTARSAGSGLPSTVINTHNPNRADEGDGVGGLDAGQQPFHGAARGVGEHDSRKPAGGGQWGALAHDHVDDLTGPRAERDAHSDLLAAA